MKKIAIWAGIATFVFIGIAQADAIQRAAVKKSVAGQSGATRQPCRSVEGIWSHNNARHDLRGV
jgi:hypothetical protein